MSRPSRARTFLKCEIRDAALAAAEHGLRITMHPTGEMELAPAGSAQSLDSGDETSAESALAQWKASRGKAPGRSHH
jgi:hypothetical protein